MVDLQSIYFSRLENFNVEDWSAEENLVKSTVARGDKRLLTNAQILEFLKSCQSCNCDKVLELLSQSLQETDAHLLMVSPASRVTVIKF
jgi:hypothetical protein